jgi:hypothetical protein
VVHITKTLNHQPKSISLHRYYYSTETHHKIHIDQSTTHAQINNTHFSNYNCQQFTVITESHNTHLHTVENLKNTQNPSITEPSFGPYNKEYIMDGVKIIIPVGKMLKWKVGRAFPLPRA